MGDVIHALSLAADIGWALPEVASGPFIWVHAVSVGAKREDANATPCINRPIAVAKAQIEEGELTIPRR